jgi:hypothetical protein
MAYQGSNSNNGQARRPYGNYNKTGGQAAGAKTYTKAQGQSDSELVSAHGMFAPKEKKEGSRTIATAYFKEETTITIPAGSTMVFSEVDPAKLADGSKKAPFSLRVVKFNDAK